MSCLRSGTHFEPSYQIVKKSVPHLKDLNFLKASTTKSVQLKGTVFRAFRQLQPAMPYNNRSL